MALAPRAYAVREGKPTDVKFQIGGNPRKLGDLVPRGVPKVFEPSGTIDLPADRQRPARTGPLADRGPPATLVARVMVNRIWQHHFGKAIVPTPSDFGLRGTPADPPRPARMAGRRLHRLGLVDQGDAPADHAVGDLPARLDEHDSANAAIDTGNAWYWRFDRRPLDAEALRDSLLALGGNLQLDRPGPHPFPAEESWRSPRTTSSRRSIRRSTGAST